MLFLAALALVTGLLFGLAPALQMSRGDGAEALKEGGRGFVGRGKRWSRNALIMSEVALAFILLSGAGLLIRSFQRLTNVDAGFDSTNVVTMYFQLMIGQRYGRRAVDDLLESGFGNGSGGSRRKGSGFYLRPPPAGLGLWHAFSHCGKGLRAVQASSLLLQDRHARLFLRAGDADPARARTRRPRRQRICCP